MPNIVDMEHQDAAKPAVVSDRGWAWTVCFAVLIWNMIIGGTMRLQGVLYLEYLDLFNQGPTATSWISFTLGIMMLIIAPIGGYLADTLTHTHIRILLLVGFTGASTCLALAGYMPNLPLTIFLFGTLGTCVGFVDPPTLSFIGKYFIRIRTLAYGISMCGGCLGNMLCPLLFYGASSYWGFRGGMLILSGLWLHALFIPTVTWPMLKKLGPNEKFALNEEQKPQITTKEKDVESSFRNDLNGHSPAGPSSQMLTDTEHSHCDDEHQTESQLHFKESGKEKKWIRCCILIDIFKNYVNFLTVPKVPLLLLTCWFGMFGYFGGFFLIPLLARDLKLDHSNVLLVFTTASISELLFKLSAGFLVDKARVSKALVLMLAYALCGVLGIAFSFVKNPLILYAYGFIIGAFGGIVLCLTIPILLDVVDDGKRGTASGMFPVLEGLASALVPVTLGAIQSSSGSLQYSILAQSAAFLLGIVSYFGNAVIIVIKRNCQNKN